MRCLGPTSSLGGGAAGAPGWASSPAGRCCMMPPFESAFSLLCACVCQLCTDLVITGHHRACCTRIVDCILSHCCFGSAGTAVCACALHTAAAICGMHTYMQACAMLPSRAYASASICLLRSRSFWRLSKPLSALAGSTPTTFRARAADSTKATTLWWCCCEDSCDTNVGSDWTVQIC